MNATGEYVLALATTLALECAVVAVAYARVAPVGRRLAVAAAANLATHGLLWAAWGALPGTYAVRLALAESAVVVLEAIAYRSLVGGGAARAAITSALANALSTGAGLGLWRALER